MIVSNEKKYIAKTAHSAFSGKPTVNKYFNDNKQSTIDILRCEDGTVQNDSYSTIGLSEYSIGLESDDKPLRVELVGTSNFECFPNILATCAFNIINSKFECYPGAIFNEVVNMYIPNGPMKHILFVPAFLWENKLETINFKDKNVAWLMIIPISDKERIYAEQFGLEALEVLLEENQIDVSDLERDSVI